MATVRLPVEHDLGHGLPVLRGERLLPESPNGEHVLCVHDVGTDLDEVAPLSAVLAHAGFVVDLVDLPGHGLSDGDENDHDLTPAAVRLLVSSLVSSKPAQIARLGLVAAGNVATVAATIGETDGVPAQVIVNPVLDPRFPAEPHARSIRMIVQGEHANLVGTRTQRYFSHILGEKLMIFHPLLSRGAVEAGRIGAVAAHVALFFRRYLIPGPRPSGPMRPAPRPTVPAPHHTEGAP